MENKSSALSVFMVNEIKQKELLNEIENNQSSNYKYLTLILKSLIYGIFLFTILSIIYGLITHKSTNFILTCLGLCFFSESIFLFIRYFIRNTVLFRYIYLGQRNYILSETELRVLHPDVECLTIVNLNEISDIIVKDGLINIIIPNNFIEITPNFNEIHLNEKKYDSIYKKDDSEDTELRVFIPKSINRYEEFLEILKEKTNIDIKYI